MRTLPVLVFIVLFLSATDCYWLASGNTFQNSYGRRNLCIYYNNCSLDQHGDSLKSQTEICHFAGLKYVLCCVENHKSNDNHESYQIEKVPPLYLNPGKFIRSPREVGAERADSDEVSVEHSSHNDGGISNSSINNEDGISTTSVAGLDPSNKGIGGDALNASDGKSASIITNSTEGLNVQEPFYRPTIENSTSLRRCREYIGSPRRRRWIIDGNDAEPKELPHMALLGYGEPNNISWQCGGSLISDQYILTAAHCIFSKLGPVRYVRLGELVLDTTTDDANETDFAVAETITHPLYDFRYNYHDIALLRLNTSITSFNDYIKPACLATTKNLEFVNLKIAGWGATKDGGPRANILQKAHLYSVPHARCRMKYGISRKLKQGIIEDVHICASYGILRTDSCQGDSGGPLQFINNHYADDIGSFIELAGVISFGYRCSKVPGVYTRVLPYVQWIESIVWP